MAFSQDLKKNRFYKRDKFFLINEYIVFVTDKQVILFSTIIHSDERNNSFNSNKCYIFKTKGVSVGILSS